jgi:hypothetical protein
MSEDGMTSEHRFRYPRVVEIKRVSQSRSGPVPRQLTQRYLVQASLLRCPDTARRSAR